MFIEMSLRRSPSTPPCSSITRLIFRTSSSDRSFTRRSGPTPASLRILFERTRPMPKMYVRPISTRFVRGRSTPAIRAIHHPRNSRNAHASMQQCKNATMQPCKTFRLAFGLLHSALTTTLFQQPAERQAWISSLSLLVLLIRTDDPHDAAAADDLALVANSLHRCSNFHDDLRLKLNIKALAAGAHPRRDLTLMPRVGFPCPQL